jgi:hypothetical protein
VIGDDQTALEHERQAASVRDIGGGAGPDLGERR